MVGVSVSVGVGVIEAVTVGEGVHVMEGVMEGVHVGGGVWVRVGGRKGVGLTEGVRVVVGGRMRVAVIVRMEGVRLKVGVPMDGSNVDVTDATVEVGVTVAVSLSGASAMAAQARQ